MKDSYKTLSGDTIKRKLVVFEAEDVNDPEWDKIIKCLQKNGFQVCFGDGNWMNIITEERRTSNG